MFYMLTNTKVVILGEHFVKNSKIKSFSFVTFFLYTSNLVAKAPGLSSGKKLSNLLTSREVLN